MHLFETISGAWTPIILEIACVSWVIEGHCMKLCYQHFTGLMPSLLSISHTFLWENDNQISGFSECEQCH